MATSILVTGNDGVSQAASVTAFYPIGGGAIADTTEANRTDTWRVAGTLSNLYIKILTNGVSATSTLRTRKNGADANIVVSITASTTGEFEDAVNTDAVGAAEDWHLSLATGASGSTLTFSICSTYFAATSDTATHFRATGAAGGVALNTGAGNTRWLGPFGDINAGAGSEAFVQWAARGTTTLKNMFLYVVANGRSSTTTFRSRKNTANGAMSLSVTAGATGVFEDTSNTDSLADGDVFNWQYTNGTGTGSVDIALIGGDLVTTDNASYVGSGNAAGISPAALATRYMVYGGRMASNAVEATETGDARYAGTASDLSCVVSANATTTDSTLKLRVDGADGNQVATITAATTGIFTDAVNTDTLVATTGVAYQSITGATGGVTYRQMWMKLTPASAGGWGPLLAFARNSMVVQ